MGNSRTRRLLKAAALAGTAAVAAASAAQAGPPPDPGWAGIPHCTVPQIGGLQLRTAKRKLTAARCGVQLPVARRRSLARRNTVLLAVPDPGTQLAPGTRVLLIVSSGKRR